MTSITRSFACTALALASCGALPPTIRRSPCACSSAGVRSCARRTSKST